MSKDIIEIINDNVTFLQYYEKQRKEIERLKEVEKEHQKLNEELREEIERLNNIINEKDCIIPYIYHKKTKTWLPLKRSDIEGGDNDE